MEIKPAHVIAAVAVTVLATWGVGELWDSFGYVTPEQHNADVATINDHQKHIEEALDRNYWTRLCDEWQEDLTDWLQADNPTRQMLENIRQKQEAISENNCYNFRE